MNLALAPYRLLDELGSARRIAFEVRDLVDLDQGELVALQKATDPAERWKLHCRAYGALEEMPQPEKIVGAFRNVSAAIATEPIAKEKKLLIGMLLNGLFVRSGEEADGYISTLSWMLAEVQPDDFERSAFPKPPKWIPLPALADAISRIWKTRRDNYGRPPPIAEVLEECTKSRHNLALVRREIIKIGKTHNALREIVAATEDSYPPEDWGIGDAEKD